jgi:uncharacterized membrane protein
MVEQHGSQRFGGETALDGSLQRASARMRGLLDRAPRLRGLVRGKWMGHPLHPAATDVPIGAFTCSLLLDALGGARGDRAFTRAADVTVAFGLAGAVGAALPGLADWSYIQGGGARRIGAVHGGANLLVLALYGASLAARRRGRRPLGVGLSGAGFAVLLFSAWLGGELSYRLGVGVHPPNAPRDESSTPGPSVLPEREA